jgi:hypothetical protein
MLPGDVPLTSETFGRRQAIPEKVNETATLVSEKVHLG